MEDPAQDQHLRKKRREDLLKLHFRDLPPQDQLRLLRELIGHMEYDLVSGEEVPQPAEKPVPSQKSLHPSPRSRSGHPGSHGNRTGHATKPEAAPSPAGKPLSASTPSPTAAPSPAADPSLSTDPTLHAAQEQDTTSRPGKPPVQPADDSFKPGKPPVQPLPPVFDPDGPKQITGEADWDAFDREMDAILHAGGELNHIHRLRLKDAMDRYASLLKRNGYIKGLPGIPELVRKAQEEEMLRLGRQGKPEWNSWVAKDQETLDRPLSHQWAEWLLPGSDGEEEET